MATATLIIFFALSVVAALAVYGLLFRVETSPRMVFALSTFAILGGATILLGPPSRKPASATSTASKSLARPLPSWVRKMAEDQPETVIEENTYQGQFVFHVMPSDRPPDAGNEHVIYSKDGHIICEFGGIAGIVSSGSYDIDQITFVRKLFP